MKTCSYCGKEYPDEATTCPVDGESLAGSIADRKKVRLSRTLEDGKTENYTINADEMIQGASGDQWLLTKGDVIFVGERIL